MPQTKAIAFTGPSDSGKTTLIRKIVSRLSPEKRIVVVKHDPKDKAVFDTPGKDSDLFFQSGADTLVLSPRRTTYFSHQSTPFESILKVVSPCDYLLVEGLKTLPLPRICVFRETVDLSYLRFAQAVACDTQARKALPPHTRTTVMDLDDIETILNWINTHAKEL